MMKPERREQPEWVMVGSRDGDQVMLLASTELTEMELSMLRAEPDWLGATFDDWTNQSPVYTVSCQMGRYVIVVAPTYAEAFTYLMRDWNPDARKRQIVRGPEPT
jgi:hypothetical protein